MHEARFWEGAEAARVRCGLCRFRCLIDDGQRGVCGVRENQQGVLYTLVYGRSIAAHVDPVEKKPLFHFHPGSKTYSIATAGCNFRCLHCQNYEIAHLPRRQLVMVGEELPPAEIVRRAKAAGCRSISYTYTEPTIFFEYAFDTAVLAKEAGLDNAFGTNGYITEEALTAIAPYLDAANVDLKGFSETFYQELAGATLQGVLDSLRVYRRLGIWTEITTLIIPGYNDNDQDLRGIARFIAEELGVATPWHVTAFHPANQLRDRPRTPEESLHRAWSIGREAGLHYVYQGNIAGAGENTHCPGCGRMVIERQGFRLLSVQLRDGKCRFCAAEVHGAGMGKGVLR
jgi:pyruvate formate lyase activating enzyme